jgi:hypothetical protein
MSFNPPFEKKQVKRKPSRFQIYFLINTWKVFPENYNNWKLLCLLLRTLKNLRRICQGADAANGTTL